MRFGSVCSGIEAASQAWGVLGWHASFLSEIEAFPSAVLAHHHPHVPNLGDMTKFKDWPDDAIDLLVGGTPCQSFSIAGLRAGLADPRGNLMLTYLAIAARYRPRWLVWENVTGVLSSNGGRDFGTFLRGLGELGYGFAYRVLDAQFCRASGYHRAVPQRRRRVFVVGYFGDWRRAAAVLFDGQSLRGDSAPRRSSGQGVAALTANGVGTYGADDNQAQAGHIIAHASPVSRSLTACNTATGRLDPNEQEFVASTPVAWSIMPQNSGKDFKARQVDVAQPVMAGGPVGGNQGGDYIQEQWAVRRLTPLECCRLQGFPDDYFDGVTYRGKKPADGPIYKALGNSMAVNTMRVIGARIAMVDALQIARAA